MHAGPRDSKMGTLSPYTAQLVSPLPIYLETHLIALKDALFPDIFKTQKGHQKPELVSDTGKYPTEMVWKDQPSHAAVPAANHICHQFPAHSHYSRQQLKGLCALQEQIFQLNTHSVTVPCQKLGILTAELAGEMMLVPGHAFTTQLLRGNPLSSALSWTPNCTWERPKCFLSLCLLRGSDSQGKEGWKCQPEQGFRKLRVNPYSYQHKQFHFALLKNNRFSVLFKQTPAVFAQHGAPHVRTSLQRLHSSSLLLLSFALH